MLAKKLMLLGALVFVTGACTVPGPPTPVDLPEAYASLEDTERVRNLNHADFDILESPTEVAEILPVVLTGKVVSVHEGPAFYSTGLTDYYSFVEIRLDELIKDEQDTRSSSVYVLIDSGGAVTDEHGVEVPRQEGESYSRLTKEELALAFPIGVNATVMGYYTTLQSPVDGAVSIRQGVKLPKDALLIGPDPQGFILEGKNHTAINMQSEQENIEFGAWDTGADAFTELVETLEEAAVSGDLD